MIRGFWQASRTVGPRLVIILEDFCSNHLRNQLTVIGWFQFYFLRERLTDPEYFYKILRLPYLNKYLSSVDFENKLQKICCRPEMRSKLDLLLHAFNGQLILHNPISKGNDSETLILEQHSFIYELCELYHSKLQLTELTLARASLRDMPCSSTISWDTPPVLM